MATVAKVMKQQMVLNVYREQLKEENQTLPCREVKTTHFAHVIQPAIVQVLTAGGLAIFIDNWNEPEYEDGMDYKALHLPR